MELNLIKFKVEGVNFGILVDEVQEIVSYPEVCPVPRPLPYVKGIFELRNRLILLIDLKRRLGAGSIRPTRNTSVIVAKLTQGFIGVLVEATLDFKPIPKEHVLPPIPLAGFREDLLKGIYLDGEEILLLPDFDKILFSFIRIQLSPIDLSDQIAFRYKFDRGRLSRVLEEIRMDQKSPFSTMQIKALARALYLPPSQLFKIASFYNRFHPVAPSLPSFEGLEIGQTGDQKYLQLALRLEEEKRKRQTYAVGTELDDEAEGPTGNLSETIEGDPSRIDLLRLAGKKLPITLYRDLARKASLPPTRLARFISFYSRAGTQSAEGDRATQTETRSSESNAGMDRGTDPSQPEALAREALRGLLSDKDQSLPELLRQIRDRQGYLTREDIQSLSQARNVPTTQIYKLASAFYGAPLTLNPQSPVNHSDPLDTSESEKSHPPERTIPESRKQILSALCKNYRRERADLSLVLSHLKAEMEVLSPDEIRYLAPLVEIPSAQLHHLLSYYGASCVKDPQL